MWANLIAKAQEDEDEEVLKEGNEDKGDVDQDPKNERADSVWAIGWFY